MYRAAIKFRAICPQPAQTARTSVLPENVMLEFVDQAPGNANDVANDFILRFLHCYSDFHFDRRVSRC